MSYFKYENFNRQLTIREGQLGHTDEKLVGITAKDQSVEAMVMVKAYDAPAVAIAVLEAAGINTDGPIKSEGSEAAFLESALSNLRAVVKRREADAEREAEEQRVRDFYRAQGIIIREVDDLHVFRFNEARKFFGGLS